MNRSGEIQEMTEKEIGAKLKQLRQKKKMTLKQLAEKAHCTDAALSKIERGEVTPTISLLKNAVNVLGVTLSEFLSNGEANQEAIVMHRDQRLRIDFQDEKIVSYQLVRNLKNKQLQPLYEIIKSGGGSGGVYTHEGEEFGIVLEGELDITVDDVTYHLKEGDSFWYRSIRPHGFKNNSDSDVKVIWVITPPTF
ncbi:MAG TPA: cupin domain-containing protein [Caldithrix abyssi]|uniref:Cupin domain-containing protein n=1 Tax=Caldithrix abyssi TaxID=187145 RepID=A0A7V1LNK0_CALAY|nr:cupin domain-containing protein [Caldithrix abyssi]